MSTSQVRPGFPPPNSRAFDELAARLAVIMAEAEQQPDTTTATSSKTKLIIGIDFGTTYTGVAYAHTTLQLGESSSAMIVEQVRDNIFPVRDFPNPDPHYPDKIRTVLAYSEDGEVAAWGGTVKPSHKTQIAFFKLGLQDSIGDFYKSATSEMEGFLKGPGYRHARLPSKSALDFAADYLKAIVNHVLNVSLPKHFSKDFMTEQSIGYVITVPAIWSDKAKNLTRQAAERAGIAEADLQMVTEPEAAALYCSTLCGEVDLTDGDRFLICDAGGGTVVSGL